MNYLRVFYASAVINRTIFFSVDYGPEEIECFAIARVADGVYGDLEPGFHHFGRQLAVEASPFTAHTAMPRFVRIIGQKHRPARAERAVVKSLDRSNGEFVRRVEFGPLASHARHRSASRAESIA